MLLFGLAAFEAAPLRRRACAVACRCARAGRCGCWSLGHGRYGASAGSRSKPAKIGNGWADALNPAMLAAVANGTEFGAGLDLASGADRGAARRRRCCRATCAAWRVLIGSAALLGKPRRSSGTPRCSRARSAGCTAATTCCICWRRLLARLRCCRCWSCLVALRSRPDRDRRRARRCIASRASATSRWRWRWSPASSTPG